MRSGAITLESEERLQEGAIDSPALPPPSRSSLLHVSVLTGLLSSLRFKVAQEL